MLGSGLAIDRLLGLLAATMGQHGAAIAHFEDALAFCERAGYPPEQAWSASDCAETLLRHGSESDRQKAITLQDGGLTIARQLGMIPLSDRTRASRQVLQT